MGGHKFVASPVLYNGSFDIVVRNDDTKVWQHCRGMLRQDITDFVMSEFHKGNVKLFKRKPVPQYNWSAKIAADKAAKERKEIAQAMRNEIAACKAPHSTHKVGGTRMPLNSAAYNEASEYIYNECSVDFGNGKRPCAVNKRNPRLADYLEGVF